MINTIFLFLFCRKKVRCVQDFLSVIDAVYGGKQKNEVLEVRYVACSSHEADTFLQVEHVIGLMSITYINAVCQIN